MLERAAPHLAMIGVHKNGTWAAQKIIECSVTDPERSMIAANLRPFAPPLMCDSLGNYVCAGTLRFGAPHSDYVFDAMADRMWDIAQNRFGARCMRTCLESPHTSLYQKVSSRPHFVRVDHGGAWRGQGEGRWGRIW
jgi:protein JSN1